MTLDIQNYMQALGQQARAASRALSRAGTNEKNHALQLIATEIRHSADSLKKQNWIFRLVRQKD